MMDISCENYFKLSRELEQHHALFYMIWEMGKPIFTEDIETAAVRFDKEGEMLNFIFNPNFWEKLSNYERQFIICHECLHVILNHGARIKDTKNAKICNMALDIVVNHTLVNNFGFQRSEISNEKNLCWVDTIFPGKKYPDDKSFEFYFNKFNSSSSSAELVDDHDGIGGKLGSSGKDSEDGSDFSSIIDSLNEKLSEEEKHSIKDIIEKHFEEGDGQDNKNASNSRGTEAGGRWTFAKKVKVKKKKKWETVIKKWARKYNKPSFKEKEQWARVNRRFASLSTDLILPTDMEVEYKEEEKEKIQVWFFQDTSGSCSGYKNRFFHAAESLNPEKFDIKMHCFDTRVYETTLESRKLYGFGGTRFSPLEDYIQKYIAKNNEKYPEAVFVITDGMGDPVHPQLPEKWYWFLIRNYRRCIPGKCNIFDLKDFE